MVPSSKRAFPSRGRVSRRDFTGLLLAAPAIAQARAANRVVIDTARVRSVLDRRLFGSFIEHLGRAVYGGIYDPGSPLADVRGYRKDVAAEIRQMAVPIVRYPGGNFVSGYNWLDGVGAREKRPRVLDRAWNSIETNQFGTDEFMDWCKLVGSAPLLGTNFGTATVESTVALLEYCNLSKGTKWSDLRREHGYEQPHNVRTWCLGNEMDGTWQIGHITAREYGRKAADAARQMRVIDRSVELIACGSSGPGQSTFLEWDREVLEECYPQVDAISLHCYYGNNSNDSHRYLGSNLEMEQQIDEIAGVCNYVQQRVRSTKRLWLSFDEWNVWYRARNGDGQRKIAPHLLEEEYNLEDALVVGGLLNSLIRRSDRVRVACLAQLVNVIAPLVTNAQGMIRQTIYFPYVWALKYAKGQALDVAVQSSEEGRIAHIDAAVTFDPSNRQYTILVLNRDPVREQEVTLLFHDDAPARVDGFESITGSDLKASNTFAAPERVKPVPLQPPSPGARMSIAVPRQSYSVLRLGA
jgi:alpha-N-arabinofuranosidase